MQKDIELIYECIFEEAYKDKAALEILISKVECKEMAVGFMMDLAMKSSMYGIEKEGMPQMIAEYIGEHKTPDYMIGCHNQFVKAMKAKNDSEIATSLFIEKALRLLIFQKSQEFDDLLSASSQKNIANLKEQLLEAEAYEYIAAIDKHIK
jgi:hypothetical protein